MVDAGREQQPLLVQPFVADLERVRDGRLDRRDGARSDLVQRERVDGRILQIEPPQHGAHGRTRVGQERRERGRERLDQLVPDQRRVRRHRRWCAGHAHAQLEEAAGATVERVTGGRHAHGAHLVRDARYDGQVGREQVEEQVEHGRRRERAVVRGAQRVVGAWPEYDPGARGEREVIQAVVVVGAQCGQQIDAAQARDGVHVRARLVDAVVVLEAAGDGAAGPRVRALQVEAVGEGERADVRAVLHLGRIHARLVDDDLAGPQQAGFARVGEVAEELGEEAAAAQPAVRVRIAPVHLGAAARSRELDVVQRHVDARRRDPLGVPAPAVIRARVAAPPFRREVARPDQRIAGVSGAGRFLDGIGDAPVVAAEVLAGDLEAETRRGRRGGAEHRVEHGPLAARDADAGARVVDGRLRDHVHHAARRVRAVERGAGAERDLDAVDVEVGDRKHVMRVQPVRRHVRVPVVRQQQQRAGEHVVEAARDDVALLQSGLGGVDARQVLDVLDGSGRDALRHRLLTADPDLGRRVQRLLGPARNRNDQRVERDRLRDQLDVEPHCLAGADPHVGAAHLLVARRANHQRVGRGRQRDLECARRVRGGRARRDARSADLDGGAGHWPAIGRAAHRAGQDAGLSGQQRRHGQADDGRGDHAQGPNSHRRSS